LQRLCAAHKVCDTPPRRPRTAAATPTHSCRSSSRGGRLQHCCGLSVIDCGGGAVLVVSSTWWQWYYKSESGSFPNNVKRLKGEPQAKSSTVLDQAKHLCMGACVGGGGGCSPGRDKCGCLPGRGGTADPSAAGVGHLHNLGRSARAQTCVIMHSHAHHPPTLPAGGSRSGRRQQGTQLDTGRPTRTLRMTGNSSSSSFRGVSHIIQPHKAAALRPEQGDGVG